MKSFINKFKYFILGGIVVMAGTVYAVQVSVPSSNGSGFLLQSGSNGLYTPVSLTAGSNVTISTTTSNITISSTGTFPFTVNSWGNSTTSTLGLLNGFISTASSTISAPLRLSSLGQGFLFTGSNGLVQPIASSSVRLSWFNNDAGFITSAVTSVTGTYPIVSSGGNTPNITFSGLGTTTNSGMSQGNLYVGSGGIFQTSASSSIFGFTPASNATTITVAGTANQISSSAGAQDLSANRTWTLSFPTNVIFPSYASSTLGFSTPYASSTFLFGNNLTTCDPTTGKLTWASGQFGCGTDQNTGGSGGNATSTIPWILYKQGNQTNLYNTISRTDVLTNTSFSTALNYVVNVSTSTAYFGQNTVFVREGYYSCDAPIILNGKETFVAPTLNVLGLASSTIISADTAKCFDFRNDARFNAKDLHVAFKANSNSFFTASTTAGTVQASIQNSSFDNIFFFSTTTGHTGYGFDFIADFRNNYHNISFSQVGNGLRSRNTYTTAQFINGDSSVTGFSFCEINNSGTGVCWDIDGGTSGRNNQWTFDDINGISNDSGAGSNDIFLRFNRTTRMRANGLNMEQFATSTQITASNGVYIESHKYINPTTGATGKAIFETDANSANVTFSCKEVEVSAVTTILYDRNTSRTQPTVLKGIEDGNCIINDDGGSAVYSTTTASIVKDVYDNVSGATWLSAIKILGDKIITNFAEAGTDWISSIGNKMSFVVGGSERLSIADSGFGTTTVTGLTVNGSATSTSNVGFNITNGCYAINGTCVGGGGGAGTVTSVVAGIGFLNRGLNITNSGTLNVGIATATNPTIGQIPYWGATGDTTNPATLSSIATSTPTVGASLSYTGTMGNVIGGSSGTLSLNMGNANSWTALQTFANSSTTYGSFITSSSTDAYFGTGQGIAYVGSNGRLRTTATSTFALSGFTNDLANLTALDTSLTFSGSYNGSVARTVGLNTGRTNTWTVLQNFNYSSSTVYSSFLTASSTNLITGFLTLSTSTAGTLKVASNGVVWSDTSASSGGYATIQDEGSGLTARTILNFTGSGVSCADDTTKTTCTINSGSATAGGSDTQVQFNDGGALGGAVGWIWNKTREIMGIGTTTPWTNHKVSIATSTGQNLVLLTGGNDAGVSFRNIGGSLYLSTTSPTTGATSTSPAGLVVDYSSGVGKVGVGSTTPWGLLSIQPSTYDYSYPLLHLSTSTTDFYGNGILHVIATSSTQIVQSASGRESEIGVRIGIGLWNYEGYGGLLDQLTVKGRINTEDWLSSTCDDGLVQNGVATDNSQMCGWLNFMEDNTGTANPLASSGGANSTRVALSTVNNDGAGYFANGLPAGWLILATSTPVMEVNLRIRNSTATTSQYYIGYTNLSQTSTTFEVEPTQGCYFTASSTTANWRAICRTNSGGANMTMVDTGIASTSVTNGTAGTGYQYRKFRIEADSTTAKFYIKENESSNMVKVAQISTTYPSTQSLNAGMHMGIVSQNANAGFDFFRVRLWWRDNLPSL